MLNITHYQRNANQNHSEVPSHPGQKMAAIKKSTNNKCWRCCREKGTFLHCWWECKLVPLGREDPQKKGKATHSSTLAWKIPWMEEPAPRLPINLPRK